MMIRLRRTARLHGASWECLGLRRSREWRQKRWTIILVLSLANPSSFVAKMKTNQTRSQAVNLKGSQYMYRHEIL